VTRLNTGRSHNGAFPGVAIHDFLIDNRMRRRFLSTDRATNVDTAIEDNGHGCGCAQPNATCPFHILKVPPTITRHQLKRIYYARCLESHPDTQAAHTKQVVPEDRLKKNTQFIAVQHAYEQACKYSYNRWNRNNNNSSSNSGLQHQLQWHRSESCPLAVSPACSPCTSRSDPFSSYSAFVRRHTYHPHDAAYRHDAGLDFNQYQPSNGRSHPLRYMTNQRFRLLVLVIAVIGVGMQYWRIRQQANWVQRRLDNSNMQASQALKTAHQRAKELGWEGQKALLEQRIANLSK
jgi:hypothetical protein